MNRHLLDLPLKTFPAALTALAAAVFLSFSVSAPAMELARATDSPVDRIIVEKSKRTMTLLKQDQEVRTYKIALGRDPVGPKVMQGDKKTPEGNYFVDYKIRNSVYHGPSTCLIRIRTTWNGQNR